MATGPKPASNAGKGLASRKTSAAQKKVDASDLAQTPDKKKSPKKNK
jgi:hypothetical protein